MSPASVLDAVAYWAADSLIENLSSLVSRALMDRYEQMILIGFWLDLRWCSISIGCCSKLVGVCALGGSLYEVECTSRRWERVRLMILRSTELSNAKRQEPLPGAPAVDVLPPATRHGSTRTVICSEGYRRLQELGSKRRETTIYTGSARRKVTAPYVQCGVDSILRPALFVVLRGMLWLWVLSVMCRLI